jgi:hypothetical protein
MLSVTEQSIKSVAQFSRHSHNLPHIATTATTVPFSLQRQRARRFRILTFTDFITLRDILKLNRLGINRSFPFDLLGFTSNFESVLNHQKSTIKFNSIKKRSINQQVAQRKQQFYSLF